MSTAQPNTFPHVLIIGAGLGGLAFAQTLRKHNISFSIYERDPSPTDRTQGWALGLSWILGPLLSSISTADKPPIEWCAINASLGPEKSNGGEGTSFLDGYTGTVVYKNVRKFEDVREVRVNRKKLREWLLMGVTVEWGKKFVRYEEDAGGVTLWFEDGSHAKGSLLVGADGVNSLVRNQLFAHSPLEAQPSCLPFTIWACPRTVPYSTYQTLASIAPAVASCYGDHFLLFLSLNLLNDPPTSGAEYLWFLSFKDEAEAQRQESGESRGVEWMAAQLEKSQRTRLEESSMKAEKVVGPLKGVVLGTREGEDEIYPVFLREVRLGEIPKGRVTLLGDAAHAMSIFNGVGGNHAILDGLKLGALLAASGPSASVPELLKTYEAEMLPRARKEQDSSRASTFAMHKSYAEWTGKGKEGIDEKRGMRAVPEGTGSA